MDCFNRFGESLLNIACRRGFEDIVAYLLEQESVSVRHCDDCGRTPLHDACWHPTLTGTLRHSLNVAATRAAAAPHKIRNGCVRAMPAATRTAPCSAPAAHPRGSTPCVRRREGGGRGIRARQHPARFPPTRGHKEMRTACGWWRCACRCSGLGRHRAQRHRRGQ